MQWRVMKIIDNLSLDKYLMVIPFDGKVNIIGSKNSVEKKKINIFLLQKITT